MARDPSKGYLRVFYGGVFVGPPLVYGNYQSDKVNVDVDKFNTFMVVNFVRKELNCPEVTIQNIYYKGLNAELKELRPLDSDESIRNIIALVEADEGVEVYVDHNLALGDLMQRADELLVEDDAEGVDGEEGLDESDDEDYDEAADLLALDFAEASDEEDGAESDEEDGAESDGDVGSENVEVGNGTQGVEDMGELTQEVESNDGRYRKKNYGPRRKPYKPRGPRGRKPSSDGPNKRARYAETIRRYKTLDEEELEDVDAEPEDSDAAADGVSQQHHYFTEFDGPEALRPFSDEEDGDDLVDEWYKRDLKFKPGMKFADNVAFKEAVRLYARTTRYDIRHLYNEPGRQIFRCFRCPWRIFASKDNTTQIFQVKTLCEKHTCKKTHYCKLLSSKDLAIHFKKRVNEDPFYKIKEMMKDTWKELKLKVNWDLCLNAKRIILKELEGNFKEEYGQIEGYANYLNSVNPGNNIRVVTGRDTPNGPLMFKKMYFCLGVIKEGWKKGCRLILGVDGCFLKSICKGMLITAIGRDGNGGFYPVAWAVVASESLDSWKWFFELLREDLEMGSGENFTIISDQAPAILRGREIVLPLAEHRLCARHIYCNLAKRFGQGDDGMRLRFWLASWSTYEEQWNKEMIELFGVSSGAYNEMMQMDKTKWCKAFFQCHSKCDSPDNNITESFNAWIPNARKKSIISMNEELMNKLIVWRRDHIREMEYWDSDISPNARKMVNDFMELAIQCHVIEAANGHFKVYDFPTKAVHEVKWDVGTCTCRAWQLTGIPCQHVLATASHEDVDGDLFVHDYYRKEKWVLAYSKNIEITRGPEMWRDWPGEKPLPPIEKRGPGRPTVKRKKRKSGEVKRYKVAKCKGAVVLKLSRTGRIMHCSICRSTEHRKPKCPQNVQANNDAQASTSTTKPKKAPSTSNQGRRRQPTSYFEPLDTTTKKRKDNGKGKGHDHFA